MLAVGCCCGLPNNTRPYNILVFLPTETKSHFMGFQPLLETLVTRGHNVTLVSPFALGSGGMALPYYTHVKVEITDNMGGSYTKSFVYFYFLYLSTYLTIINPYQHTNKEIFKFLSCIRHLE